MKLWKLYSSFVTAVFMAGYLSASQIVQSTIYIDANDNPGSPTWNMVDFSSAGSRNNMVDSNGDVTDVDVDVVERMWGVNSASTSSPIGDAAEFLQAGNNQSFGCYSNWTGTATDYTQCIANISGLLPGTNYTFTFYASRMGVSDNRETLYALTGANSGSAVLNVQNNTSEVAVVSGIVADANGEIELLVRMGPNNNNSEGFFYLLAMKIEGMVAKMTLPQPEFPVYLNFGGPTISDPVATGIGFGIGTVYGYLVDSNNVDSPLSLEVIDRFHANRTVGSSTTFSGDALEFGLACRTGLYGDNTDPHAEYELTGADENYLYTFTFFSCREGQTDNREAMFIVTGATSATNYLDASSNYSEVAVIDSRQCDGSGKFTITIVEGPNNNNGNNWFYLNAMKIEAEKIAEPPPVGTVIFLL
jgi:hypothetical protein